MTAAPTPTCHTCTHWEAAGTPPWAAAMGMALCLLDRTAARTLCHWHTCSRWRAAPADEVQRRARWLARKGASAQRAPAAGRTSATPASASGQPDAGTSTDSRTSTPKGATP